MQARREKDAADASAAAARAHALAPSAALVHARCLLRSCRRLEGLGLLDRAAALPAGAGDGDADAAWARGEIARVRAAVAAAAARRGRAIALYERGSFTAAAAACDAAVALLVGGGGRDDKRGRADIHADAAGCLRRARAFDDAVAAADAALRLMPRHSVALFRRAACLLESGAAKLAVAAFENLYRVRRTWPRLSEWLVRAHAAARRAAKAAGASAAGAEAASGPPDEGDDDDGIGGSGGGGGGGGGRGGGGGGGSYASAEEVARDPDHYRVLGVASDATEAAIKSAYRMMSLRFHPDRKGGSTAAFQRVAAAYRTLSEAAPRAKYDEGGDVKARKRGAESESGSDSDEAEEHKCAAHRVVAVVGRNGVRAGRRSGRRSSENTTLNGSSSGHSVTPSSLSERRRKRNARRRRGGRGPRGARTSEPRCCAQRQRDTCLFSCTYVMHSVHHSIGSVH